MHRVVQNVRQEVFFSNIHQILNDFRHSFTVVFIRKLQLDVALPHYIAT